VLDVGCGTGISAPLFATTAYIGLDLDAGPLREFRRIYPALPALRADSAALPIATAAADLVLFRAVLHHLDDAVLREAVAEAARVLRPEGRLVILEPVPSARLRARLLWRLDRGSHPRSAQDLRAVLLDRFVVDEWQSYAIHHEYALGVLSRRAGRKSR
jgi:SAM-dependent methyltransferase